MTSTKQEAIAYIEITRSRRDPSLISIKAKSKVIGKLLKDVGEDGRVKIDFAETNLYDWIYSRTNYNTGLNNNSKKVIADLFDKDLSKGISVKFSGLYTSKHLQEIENTFRSLATEMARSFIKPITIKSSITTIEEAI